MDFPGRLYPRPEEIRKKGAAGDIALRKMEFKMERPGLLEAGQKITVTEGLLPSNYYYVIDPALAMSANIPFRYRLKSTEGIVTDVIENDRGFYVTAEFDEPEIDQNR